ncbi:hypothetical protein UFOVP733_10 [uncultured Caudovirales phage]|uniref:Uncharacterized protein n=1 Tax=uncultured Caudovirales phage TaxID=2100421 RepID=A0A6J7X6A8_9CAUD|nr:hypothetical protein UFOVP733_10 [uncultured Caudovirales phage]CAB5224957.1 hypothetical protein UFOVP743_49 [uncultured Caudovirales phage]
MLRMKEIQNLICCDVCKNQKIVSADYKFMCKYCQISTKDLYDAKKFCECIDDKMENLQFWEGVANDINEKDEKDLTSRDILKIIRENGGKIKFKNDILTFYMQNWPLNMALLEITCHKLISEYAFIGI